MHPEERRAAERQKMVERQIAARGIDHPAVLQAMRRVERDRFVPTDKVDNAYDDGPLAIGSGQTISQPYIAALLTQLIRPLPEMRVLDVGTGSGYQAALLAECVGEVFSIEILPQLARQAAERLRTLGYRNIATQIGDGSCGWPEHAPYDAIVVAAAPSEIPPALLEQLAPGGRMVLPVGESEQRLTVVTRIDDDYRVEPSLAVRFVPMTGAIADDC